MTQLSDSQIEQLLADAGFSASVIPTFVAIAHAESGGNTEALNPRNANGTSDIGLFQINSAGGFDNSRLYDPVYNTEAAYSLYSRRGTEPWNSSKSRWGNAVTNTKPKGESNIQKGMAPWKDLFTGQFGKIGGDLSTAAHGQTVAGAVAQGVGASGLAGWAGEGVKYAAIFILGLMFLILGFVVIFRKPIGDVASKVPAV
jgi:hypothetical protein